MSKAKRERGREKETDSCGVWVVQLAKCLALDFVSGNDFRDLRWTPTLDSTRCGACLKFFLTLAPPPNWYLLFKILPCISSQRYMRVYIYISFKNYFTLFIAYFCHLMCHRHSLLC